MDEHHQSHTGTTEGLICIAARKGHRTGQQPQSGKEPLKGTIVRSTTVPSGSQEIDRKVYLYI